MFHQGFSCLDVLWILTISSFFRIRAFHPLWIDFPDDSSRNPLRCVSPNPRMHALWFGLFPFRSPLLRKSNFLSLPLPTQMFQFRRFPSCDYFIHHRMTEVYSAGFPHSEICGSKDICSSPQLIAAYHVFHRLSVPRHPPCALCCLIRFHTLVRTLNSFSPSDLKYFFDTCFVQMTSYVFQHLLSPGCLVNY